MMSKWSEVQQYLTKVGQVIFNIKKLREEIENDRVQNAHLGQVLGLLATVRNVQVIDESIAPFCELLDFAISYTKFVKATKGISEDSYRAPIKKIKQSMASPDSRSVSSAQKS